MLKPYSQNLRDCLIGAVKVGIAAHGVGRLFYVGESVAIKWVERWRWTGCAAAKRMAGYPIHYCFSQDRF